MSEAGREEEGAQSLAATLRRLHELHEEGALSADEYQQAKRHVLDGSFPTRTEHAAAADAPSGTTASVVTEPAPLGRWRGKLAAVMAVAVAVGTAGALALASGVGDRDRNDAITVGESSGGAGADPDAGCSGPQYEDFKAHLASRGATATCDDFKRLVVEAPASDAEQEAEVDLADEGCWLPFETASGELDCAEGFVTEGQTELTPATFARLRLLGGSSTREDGSAKPDCEVAEDVLSRATRGQDLTAEDVEYSLRPGGGLRGTLQSGAGTTRDYDILVACTWLIVSPGD